MHNCSKQIIGKVSHVIVGGGAGVDYKLPIASDTILGGIKLSEDLLISKDGILRINIEEINRKLGGELKDKHYRYKQNISSNHWKIHHDLDKYPTVIIFDSSNTQVIGDINYIDNNNLEILFSSEFCGVAYLN